jgi:octaprenyl-diphosphate synthase
MNVVVKFDREDGRRKAPSIETLTRLTSTELVRVNQVILERMQSPVVLIPQVAGYIIAAGGKRMRPMLTLAAAKLCGYGGDRHVGLAACVEFIHTATLLHDDVVDGSDLRRGSASANAVWGNQSSVLVGDFLFSRAFELMVQDGSLEVLRILSHASSVIAEGEVLQLITAQNPETTEEDYFDVIRAKTAKLFAAACEIGAVVAERPRDEWQALETFGHNLGMAFQLVDDVLDYTARPTTLGKNLGDDFREGKITLPVVFAYRAADAEGKEFLHRTFEELKQEKTDFKAAVAMLERTGALRATMDAARHYAAKARQALDPFPAGPVKDALLEAVEFTVDRGH